jgi:hypothetical protein
MDNASAVSKWTSEMVCGARSCCPAIRRPWSRDGLRPLQNLVIFPLCGAPSAAGLPVPVSTAMHVELAPQA